MVKLGSADKSKPSQTYPSRLRKRDCGPGMTNELCREL